MNFLSIQYQSQTWSFLGLERDHPTKHIISYYSTDSTG